MHLFFFSQFNGFEIKACLTIGGFSWFNWQCFFLSLWYIKIVIHLLMASSEIRQLEYELNFSNERSNNLMAQTRSKFVPLPLNSPEMHGPGYQETSLLHVTIQEPRPPCLLCHVLSTQSWVVGKPEFQLTRCGKQGNWRASDFLLHKRGRRGESDIPLARM